jgi:plasmid stability protein
MRGGRGSGEGLTHAVIHGYTVSVKNVTVSLDDATYRHARIVAAERGLSVSALVRELLNALKRGGDETARLKQAEQVLREQISEFRAADRLPRDELHGRARPSAGKT